MSAATLVRRRASWRERRATLAIFLALGMCVGVWAAVLPALTAALGLGAGELSLVLLTLAISSLAGTVAMGAALPRFGSGAATGASCVVMVLAFGLPGLASGAAQLAAVGVLMGLAAGVLEVAVNGHASDIEQRWTSAIMSSFHAAFSIGGLLGSAFGGLAAWAGAGVQGRLWLPLAVALLVTLAALPGLGPGVLPGAGRQAASERLPPWWRRLEGVVLILSLVSALSYMLEGAITDWSGVYLSTVVGAPAWVAAAGYAAFSATMTLGRLTGDAVVNRLGARRVLLLSGLVAATGFALVVAVPWPGPAVAGFALVGIGAANIVPVVISGAGRLSRSPAAGIATVAGFGFAGFLGGPPLIGGIATVAGLRAGLCVLVVAALAVMGAAWFLRALDQRDGRRSRT